MSVNRTVLELVTEELDLDAEPDPDTHLLDELGLDSAGLMSLAMALEAEFGIELEEAEFTRANFESVASISRLVDRRLAP